MLSTQLIAKTANAALLTALRAIAVFCALIQISYSQVNITTYHNDNARTGQNRQETTLTLSNVNSTDFGKLFSVAVDGNVYAQPLYVSGLSIAAGTHNVVYVATEHDSVYAIDANNGAVYWHISLIPSGATTVSTADVACTEGISPEIGITGTPVIDTISRTLYVVAATKQNGVFRQRLHAIDLVTHAEKFGGPVAISASVPGNGPGSSGGILNFDALRENQRPGLLLVNGHVIISWASHCDNGPYHGWVMSYTASTLAQEAVFNTTPNGEAGGIWMSGGAPASDTAFNIYFATGNGNWDGKINFGDSILKVAAPIGGKFPLSDWFTSFNQLSLSGGDTDLGSGGVLLLPALSSGSHPNLLVEAGKEGRIYLIDRSNLGHFCSSCTSSDTQIVQELPGALAANFTTPAYWNGHVYFAASGQGGADDVLKAFSFNANNSGLLSSSPVAKSSNVYFFPGATPSISANGSTSGIVWTVDSSGYLSGSPAVLHAHNASNVALELYNTKQAPNSRDQLGGAVRFAVPTVANGKVYVGSKGRLDVLGLFGSSVPKPDFTLGATPSAQTVAPGGSTTYTVTVGVLNGFTGTVSLAVSGLPSGATGTFNPATVIGSGKSTLSVQTATTSPATNVTLTVTGTSGTLKHSTTVGLTVKVGSATDVISINFVGTGTLMGSTEVAGVVAKSHWNNAGGSSGSGLALVDENGTATGATVSWQADNTAALPIVDQAGNYRMMRGYLNNINGDPTTVTISGLPSNANGYAVYVYADGDNGTVTRAGNYQISGTGITTASVNLTDAPNTNFSGTFTQANNSNGNYVVFSGINATRFTLTATPTLSSNGNVRAPVNGIQVVPH